MKWLGPAMAAMGIVVVLSFFAMLIAATMFDNSLVVVR